MTADEICIIKSECEKGRLFSILSIMRLVYEHVCVTLGDELLSVRLFSSFGGKLCGFGYEMR